MEKDRYRLGTNLRRLRRLLRRCTPTNRTHTHARKRETTHAQYHRIDCTYIANNGFDCSTTTKHTNSDLIQQIATRHRPDRDIALRALPGGASEMPCIAASLARVACAAVREYSFGKCQASKQAENDKVEDIRMDVRANEQASEQRYDYRALAATACRRAADSPSAPCVATNCVDIIRSNPRRRFVIANLCVEMQTATAVVFVQV
jgi:hypothetical protein